MTSTIDSNTRAAIQISKFGLAAIALGFLLAFVLPLIGGGESFIGYQIKKVLVLTTLIHGLWEPDSLLTPLIGCLLMAAGFFMIALKSYGVRGACYTAFIGALLPAALFFVIYQGGNDPDGLMHEMLKSLVEAYGVKLSIMLMLAIFPLSFLMMAIGLLSVGMRTVLKTNRFSALGMLIVAVAFVFTMLGLRTYFKSEGQDDAMFEFGCTAVWVGIAMTLISLALSMFIEGASHDEVGSATPVPPMPSNRQPATPQAPANDGYVSWRDARTTHGYAPEPTWRKPEDDVTVSLDELRYSESDDRTSESLFVILRNPSLHTRTELENAAMALYNRRDPLYLSAFRTMDRDALRAIADNSSAHLRAEVLISEDILAGRL